MNVRIRNGAVVYQDFRGKEWPFTDADVNTVFIAKPDEHGHIWLEADGYGSFVNGEKYGNGKMCAKAEDLIPLFDRLPQTTHEGTT